MTDQDFNQGFYQDLPIPTIVGETDHNSNQNSRQASPSFNFENNSYNPTPTSYALPPSNDKIFIINLPGFGNPVGAPGGGKIHRGHSLSNSIGYIFKVLGVPLITTFLTILIPMITPKSGFLHMFQYTLIYIPVVSGLLSAFLVGWASKFNKNLKSKIYIPVAFNMIFSAITFSLISEYSSSYPPPIIISLVFVENAVTVPIIIYFQSSQRFNMEYLKSFSKYLVFIALVLMSQMLCLSFAILFCYMKAQLAIMLIYFFLVFVFNHCLLWITRSATNRTHHNIISYWIETLSEGTICFMYVNFTKTNFLILLLVRVILMSRYVFFLSDRYWNLRTSIKDHSDKSKQMSWLNTNRYLYTGLSFIFPTSMDRDEHKTRVVDRVFYTFLAYCSVPLLYILFAVCLRFSHNSQFYPFNIDMESFMLVVIYAFFSSFLSFIVFLVVRYLLQTNFEISVLNHPIQLMKLNCYLLMFSNFSALLLPITFMLYNNNVYYLVNSLIIYYY
ncbi:hypothetical protein CYY_000539 [Polysphondylium violaceum]|uniref:Transmembrane protein n=1 Tax=Polysphondylium violaceum TaxID=133409 RepID=A0A8J4Q2L6_9MYCE|nr:hypothetical protein CYY_000539 [Polysphondylium violaceum]